MIPRPGMIGGKKDRVPPLFSAHHLEAHPKEMMEDFQGRRGKIPLGLTLRKAFLNPLE